jgi:PAS domain-containing protein
MKAKTQAPLMAKRNRVAGHVRPRIDRSTKTGPSNEVPEEKESDDALKALLKEVIDLKAALDEHAIVAMTDGQGKITYVNDKFCAISKYSREELLGQDHRIIKSG